MQVNYVFYPLPQLDVQLFVIKRQGIRNVKKKKT